MRLSFPPRGETFFEATIAGARFAAGARGDPYVTNGEHSIQLGHAAHVLYLTEGNDHRFTGPGWYVCKYGPGEIKFGLPLFGEGDALHFAECFGMAFKSTLASRPFADSPAGKALAEYFSRFPRRIQRCSWSYLQKPSKVDAAT
jgi:hypothetical protein